MFNGSLWIYFTALSVFINCGIGWYSWKIWKLNLADSFTWSMLFFSAIIQLIQIGRGFYYIRDIQVFLGNYPPSVVIISYMLTTLQSLGIFIFVFNIYRGLKKILPSLK